MKSFLLLFFLALSAAAQASGLSDWDALTPGKHRMGNDGGGNALYTSDTSGIYGIREWYFYKNDVVGRTDSLFFIFSEATGHLDTYTSEAARKAVLTQRSLVPPVWTRWHSGDWRFYEEAAIGLFMLAIIAAVPVTILLIYTIHLWINNRLHYRIGRWPRLFFITITFLAVLRFLLDRHPESF